jgi:Chaperone of endosialidase
MAASTLEARVMHRIDTDGHQNGLFDEGDPVVGRLPTQLGKNWLNDLQENVVIAVEGAEPLKKGDTEQLRRAIRQCGHTGIGVERTPSGVTFRGNTTTNAYDDSTYTELVNGIGEGQVAIRATSAGGGKPVLQLWGVVNGTLAQVWRAGADGSGSVSDERLKDRLGYVSPAQALAAIRNMRAEWFTWKGANGTEPSCGLIAQKVTAALEEAGLPIGPFVLTSEDGTLMPNRDALLALLFSAIGNLADRADS